MGKESSPGLARHLSTVVQTPQEGVMTRRGHQKESKVRSGVSEERALERLENSKRHC